MLLDGAELQGGQLVEVKVEPQDEQVVTVKGEPQGEQIGNVFSNVLLFHCVEDNDFDCFRLSLSYFLVFLVFWMSSLSREVEATYMGTQEVVFLVCSGFSLPKVWIVLVFV